MIKISIIFLVTAFAFGYQINIPNVQCACQQIISQVECNNWNCEWVAENGYCDQIPCGSLNQQQCNNEPERCYYQESDQLIKQVCYPFAKCEDVVLKPGQTCQQANPKCVQSKNNLCISVQSCQGLTQIQCAGTNDKNSTQVIADEGMCFWNGQTCQVVLQCEELQNDKICNYLQNACHWTGTKCASLTCSSFTTNETCRFVQTTPLSGALIQFCVWNGQNCINSTSDQLSQFTCASNTNYHYRWIPFDYQNGICAQCAPYQYQFLNECECDQLFQQSECNNSFACKWILNSCTKLQCSEITSQQQCAQIHGCYWNALIIPSLCLPYSSCTQILGKKDFLCIQASIYCPSSNGTNCQPQDFLQKCQDFSNINPNLCYNSIGSDGYCTYDIGTKTCSNVQACSQLATKQLCNQFNTICIWSIGTAVQCQQKQCKDYKTQSSCAYIQNINTNIINICTWNPDVQMCTLFDNSIHYDVNQCYNQTGRTYHWSQPLNTSSKGLCLPCKFSSILNVKSKCECADLYNYNECIQSFPNCNWDANTQTCNVLQCSLLTNQAQCILNKECYWNSTYSQTSNVNNSTSSACSTISNVNNSTSQFCSTLQGQTQQECLSQSILCPGVTEQGKCQSSLNNCNDYNTFYQCFASLGADGLCQWNKNTSSCLGVNSCNMIYNEKRCNSMVSTCYWEPSLKDNCCQQYNCTTLYNQTQSCDYFFSQPNQQYEVKFCSMSGNTCNLTQSVNNLMKENCYNSSGRTASWNQDDTQCVICYCQFISIIIMILISIL